MSKRMLTIWMRGARNDGRNVILSAAKNLQPPFHPPLLRGERGGGYPSVTTLPQDDKTRNLKGCGYRIVLCALFVSLLLGLLAVPALADDPLNDGYPDIVIGNNRSGSSTYYDNSYVYWGNSEAQYASKNIFATMGAIGNSVADLNNDGYMDIVYSNYHDNSGHFELNSYIYWGAESNPYSSSTLLPTIGAIGNSVADLNNDGYLDIVFSNHKNDAGAHPINSYIYWGSGSGYSTSSRSLVPVLGGVGNAVTDIDNDGYLDIAFANLHDNSSYNINSYIYWGSSSGYSTSSRSQLATHGATAVSVGDLNNDGYSDVVFSNSTTADPTYNINSYVYWGGESRSFSSKTDLPTSLAHNSTLSDLNSDGYLDIVFSNYYNGSSGNINSYIYWGSSSGYSTSSRMGLPTKFALGNAVSDLNSDGYLDIVFATNIENDNFNTNSIIYWGAESGYSASSKSLLASMGAYGITIADTNILYANQAYGDTLPLWVTQNDYDADILGTAEYQFIALKNELLNEGALDFSDEEIAQLAKLYFDQVGTVEIDGTTWRYYSDEIGGHGVPEAWYDGDYYFQMGSGVTTAEGEIPEPSTVVMMVVLLVGLGVVYRRKFGKPVIARSEATKQSQRSARSKEIASSLTFLAMVVIILSLSAPTANAGTLEDGEPDIIFANSFDWGTFQFDPNSYIYWGAQTNPFSSKTELYTKGAYTCLAADLNNDGYRDPIFLNYFDNPVNNSYIYWGAATSPYSSRTDIWTDSQPGGVSSADLNDDGYVDIVISHQYDTDWYTNSYIYWGAASNPYSSKMELPTVGGTGNTVGDLNDDGYLDIVIANFYDGGSRNINSYVYWGAASNPYSSKTELPTHGAYDASTGDLDNDGYLDIVFSNIENGTSYQINSYIYWGAATNPYSTKTELATNYAYGNSIADLNNDGILDIVFANYYDNNSYIYWGAATSSYSSKTELSAPDAVGTAVGDLDGDGWLDIVFTNGAAGNSYVYWGAESNPYSSKTELADKSAFGVAIVDGNSIWSGNVALGSIVPLWATQGDYSTELLNSWQYGFMSTQYDQLNEGALDFSDEEIAQLAKLYFDQVGTVEIDGTTWRYYSDEIGEHGVPEAWYDGDYYFQMGSGVTTAEGEIPEPSTVVMMVVLLVGFGWLYRKRNLEHDALVNRSKSGSLPTQG